MRSGDVVGDEAKTDMGPHCMMPEMKKGMLGKEGQGLHRLPRVHNVQVQG